MRLKIAFRPAGEKIARGQNGIKSNDFQTAKICLRVGLNAMRDKAFNARTKRPPPYSRTRINPISTIICFSFGLVTSDEAVSVPERNKLGS